MEKFTEADQSSENEQIAAEEDQLNENEKTAAEESDRNESKQLTTNTKKKTKKRVLLHFKYDDGSIGCIFFGKKKKSVRWTKYARTKAEWNELKRKVKKAESTGCKVVYRQVNVAEYMSNRNLWIDDLKIQIGWDHFSKLFFAFGPTDQEEKEAAMLISGMLSAYTVYRMENCGILDCYSPMERRGLIFMCSYQSGAFYSIEHIVRSLSVDVYENHKKSPLYLEAPTILPQKPISRKLVDSAVIYGSISKKQFDGDPLPMQYRNSVILIDGRFYSAADIRDFERRNRWNSILVYGKAPSTALFDPIILSAKIHERMTPDWDDYAVNNLCTGFIGYLMKKSKKDLKRYCKKIEERFILYLENGKALRVKAKDRYRLFVQLATVELFFRFLSERNVSVETEKIHQLMLERLLPGYASESIPELSVREHNGSAETDMQSIFEDVLQKLLEEKNRGHFSLPDSTKEKGHDNNSSEHTALSCWGTLATKQKYGKSPAFFAIKFEKAVLEEVLKEYLPPNCSFDALWNYLKEERPNYVHKSFAMKDKEGEKVDALILKVDQMDFLPEETMSWLNEQGNRLRKIQGHRPKIE